MTFRHALLAACAFGATSLAAAHHSPAMFDMTTTVVIEGTVNKVVCRNDPVDAAGWYQYLREPLAQPGQL